MPAVRRSLRARPQGRRIAASAIRATSRPLGRLFQPEGGGVAQPGREERIHQSRERRNGGRNGDGRRVPFGTSALRAGDGNGGSTGQVGGATGPCNNVAPILGSVTVDVGVTHSAPPSPFLCHVSDLIHLSEEPAELDDAEEQEDEQRRHQRKFDELSSSVAGRIEARWTAGWRGGVLRPLPTMRTSSQASLPFPAGTLSHHRQWASTTIGGEHARWGRLSRRAFY